MRDFTSHLESHLWNWVPRIYI